MLRHRRKRNLDADLDITSFMNLMIILVPVLLMNMVFTQITVLELTLPGLSADDLPPEIDENTKLEVVIRKDYFDVNFPEGIRLKRITQIPQEMDSDESPEAEILDYDYVLLSNVLQEVKRQLKDKDIDKKDIVILSEADTDYQTLIRVMDTVRSFKAVVVTSVVDAELFPQISMGDAPVAATGGDS